MPLNYPQPSMGSAAEFQSSGLPWVTSSAASTGASRYDFPKVTRSINVRNTTTGSGGFLKFGFTQNGVDNVTSSNYYTLPPGANEVFEVRVKEVWIAAMGGPCNFSMFAALTTVPSKEMPILTGSVTGSTASGWIGVG